MAKKISTAQQTFTDLYDSYTLNMSTSVIPVLCDAEGVVLESTISEITYDVVVGEKIIPTVCSSYKIMVGEYESTSTGITIDKNSSGKLKITIPKDLDINDQEIEIEVIVTTNDSNEFDFKRHISIIASKQGVPGRPGDPGQSAVEFVVHSEQGWSFEENMSSITFQAIGYDGATLITSGATYKWYYRGDTSLTGNTGEMGKNIGWIEIADQIGSTFVVNKSDLYAISVFKCEMTYKEKTYTDIFSTKEAISVYDATIKFFDGSNVFAPSVPYLVAYVELRKNNTIVNPLKTEEYYNGNSSVSNGVITTDLSSNMPSGKTIMDKDYLYFICGDKVVLGQYNSGRWVVADETDGYIYRNNIYPDIYSNIMLISKHDVSHTQRISFDVYNAVLVDGNYVYDEDTFITYTETIIIDINDPVVSENMPANPSDGQLWLDLSVTPSVLKMYNDSIGEWVQCYNQNGQTIYTSQPNKYCAGDLWVLAEGESCECALEQSYIVDATKYPESKHNYTSNIDDIQYFSVDGARKLILTFSDECQLENGPDDLYIYTGKYTSGATPIASYTGTAMAGQTLEVDSGSVSIRLVADSSVSYYGYSFSSIEAVTAESITYGEGTILRAMQDSGDNFDPSDWTDVMKDSSEFLVNAKQYFHFNPDTGLKIGQKDERFYVNIKSTRMSFVDNSTDDNNDMIDEPINDNEVVYISQRSATIRNAIIEESADFNCPISVDSQIDIYSTNDSNGQLAFLLYGGTSGFGFQLESDGSFSLVFKESDVNN